MPSFGEIDKKKLRTQALKFKSFKILKLFKSWYKHYSENFGNLQKTSALKFFLSTVAHCRVLVKMESIKITS